MNDPVGLTVVAAMGRRGEIGRDGGLLFRLKDDMLHFRRVTKGRPVIMGRKTWESLPKKPLPGRANLVISRNAALQPEGAHMFSSLPVASAAASAIAGQNKVQEACVIGGGQIYAAAMPIASRLWLTEIDAEADADVFFPEFDRSEWNEVASSHVAKDDDNEAPFTIREFVRKS